MQLTDDERAGLDMALNEADFCDIRINERSGEVRLLFVVLTLPDEGPEPDDRRAVLRCLGTSRIVASLREGAWDDARAPVAHLQLRELPTVVRSFGSQPVYGWEFFDLAPTRNPVWRDRASLDFSVSQGRGEHSIDLFQTAVDEPLRHLDLRIEFDELEVTDGNGDDLSLDEFVAGGRRWWDALEAGDPRVAGHGITLPGHGMPPAEEDWS